MSTTARAAAYIRMSSEHQELSIGTQLSAIQAYADAHGLELVHTYEDAAKSGLQISNREGMKSLLTDQLLADLDYLEKVGMTVEQLRSLHQWSDKATADRVTFRSVRDYFSHGHPMKSNNAAFAERLRLVRDLHQRGLEGLIAEATRKHPL